MTIHEGKTEYFLSRPLNYSYKGESRETRVIELREPSMEHVSEYTKLKQMLGRAQMELAERSGQLQRAMDAPQAGEEVKSFGDQAEEIEAETMAEAFTLAILSSERVDAAEFVNTFQKMACKMNARSVCIIDGEQQMTGALWSKLHPDDGLNMAVRWCSFFATASEGAAKSTSEQQQESHLRAMEV